MASLEHGAPSPAQQPDLRSFIVYTALPEGMVAFEVQEDDSVPFLRAGEFVVIDPADVEPAEGELFVIGWKSAPDGKQNIVRMDLQEGVFAGKRQSLWFAGPCAVRELVTMSGKSVSRPMRWADGPYYPKYLREIIKGRTVGILEPDFRKQLGRPA